MLCCISLRAVRKSPSLLHPTHFPRQGLEQGGRGSAQTLLLQGTVASSQAALSASASPR